MQTYSYEDLLRDLNAEIEAWQKERERKKGRRAEGLGDVFGDLGEELLDFLEMGIEDDEGESRVGGSGRLALAPHNAFNPRPLRSRWVEQEEGPRPVAVV